MSTQTARAAQRAQTGAAILTSARRLAWDGFASLRTAAVASAAGVSHGAVFVHYPSRDDLVASVADAVAEDITRALTDAPVAYHVDLADGLRHHLNVITEHAAEYRSLMMEAMTATGAVRQVWTALQREIVDYLTAVITAAQSEVAIDVDAARETWMALVHHALIRSTPADQGRRRWPDVPGDLVGWFVSLARD